MIITICKIKEFGVVLFVVFLLMSCSEETYRQQIQAFEEKASAEQLTVEEQEELLNLYEEAAEAEEDTEEKTAYLWRSAEVARNMGDFERAEKNYKKIYTEYSGSAKADNALFLHAFLMDEHIKDLPKAKRLYSEFLENYPDSELFDDAQFLLNHLGASDEEILRELIAKDTVEQL